MRKKRRFIYMLLLSMVLSFCSAACKSRAAETGNASGPSMYDYKTFNVLPYSDGIAWIQYGDSNNPTSAAVDINGNILFTLEETVNYLAPFSSGYSYYVARDDAGAYEVIVDTSGNKLWVPDRENNEHIVTGGDGVFVVERHTTGFSADYMEVGTVDANGNTIREYAHEINGVYYNEENHLDYYGSKPTDSYTRCAYGNFEKFVPHYMGDGLYRLSAAMLYNPDAEMLYYKDRMNSWPESTSNGRFRTVHSDYGPETAVATLYDTSMNVLASDPYYYYERTVQSTYDLDRTENDYSSDCTSYKDGLFYKAHAYWNDENEIVMHIDGYSSRRMQGGPFYDGKAVLWVEGADRHKYMTVIDEEGTFLFDPVPILDGYFTIWNGLILAIEYDETGYGPWVIYNTKGELLHNIEDELMHTDEGNYAVSVSDISEGYAVVTYGRQKSKMLYSLRNFVEQVEAAQEADANTAAKAQAGAAPASDAQKAEVSRQAAKHIASSDTNAKEQKVVADQVIIPDKALSYNGHHYYIYRDVKTNWNDAQENCKERGGYLAVINDRKENEKVYKYMVSMGYDQAYFGLIFDNAKDDWDYLYGDTSTFRDWGVNSAGVQEPNNADNGENHTQFDVNMSNGHWNDAKFGAVIYTPDGHKYKDRYTYICEWDQ